MTSKDENIVSSILKGLRLKNLMEYGLWPNRSTSESMGNSAVSRESAQTEVDGGASRALQSVKNAVQNSMGPNVTLREAACHMFVRGKSPHWNLRITVEADAESKEDALTKFVASMTTSFPEDSRIKYIQYHRIGAGYWSIDVEVPVK